MSLALLPGPVLEFEPRLLELLTQAATGLKQDEPLEKLASLSKSCSVAATLFNTEKWQALKQKVDTAHAESNAQTQLEALDHAADALLSKCTKESLKTFVAAFESAKPWVVCGGQQAALLFDMSVIKRKMVQSVLPKVLELYGDTLAADEPVGCPLDVSGIVKSLHKARLT